MDLPGLRIRADRIHRPIVNADGRAGDGNHDGPAGLAGADLQAAHGDGKIFGRAQQSGIIRQGVLRLCHAHRQIAEAELCEPLCLLLGSGGQHGLRAAVDALHDGVELVDKRGVGGVGEGKFLRAGLLAQAHDLFSKRLAALSALGPDLGEHRPNAVVIVATVRALKSHGGVPKAELNTENLVALEKGLPNLLHHVNTIRSTYHLPCVVAINAFPTDTEAELRLVEDKCRELGVRAVLSEVWAKGGEGGKALAAEVVRLCEEPCPEQPSPEEFTFAYPDNTSLIYKLNAIVNRVYGGAQAVLTPVAQKQAKQLFDLGFGDLPVCMAKTQYSLSDDPTLLGAPEGFTVTVRNIKVSAGAGFLVALTGDILTMPGLPKVPAAEKIDVDEHGKISGLF